MRIQSLSTNVPDYNFDGPVARRQLAIALGLQVSEAP